jgi:hypothetical protein
MMHPQCTVHQTVDAFRFRDEERSHVRHFFLVRFYSEIDMLKNTVHPNDGPSLEIMHTACNEDTF